MIGEIGLDSVDGPLPIHQQQIAFEAQLTLAKRAGLPVNLHLRGAIDEAFALLAGVGLPRSGAVLHYFVGDEALTRQALDLGLYVSVGKPVTRLENGRLRDAVRRIPLERLLLETDSYPLPGRTTEPADVWLVAQAVAALLETSEAEVARVTSGNLLRLLGDRSPGSLRWSGA
jgi:TatD DNase family protein